jgi:CO/xanthine dehydrogenase Mo-binding subunit
MVVSAVHCMVSGDRTDAEAVRHALAGNLCRCSGYEQIVEASAAAAGGHSPPEVPRPRLDLREKMQGSARYPTDRQVESALIGRVLWSEWPSARIAGIDTSEAESVPGVEAVLTHRDISGRNLFGVTVFSADQPLLAVDRVRSSGDAIALVAARTEEAAREAVRRIRVTYEPLPSVHDVLEALAPGAPHVGSKGNLVAHFVKVRGDGRR